MWDNAFAELADLLPVGVLVFGPRGELEQANEPALRWLSLDRRAVGRTDVADSLDAPALRQVLAGASTGPSVVEARIGNRVVAAEVRPLAEGRRLVSLRDITALSGVSHLRRNLVSEVLHRLRTRLTTILSVLSMTSGNRLVDKSRLPELLGMANREAERLAAFVGRLRDLFLVETGTVLDEIELQPVRLSEVLARVVKGFRPRFEGKGQLVAEEYPSPEHPALADPELLARVLVHVLRNAHVHTPAGTWVRVRLFSEPDRSRIEVADNGPGIPQAELPQAFTCFRRREGEEAGEGLGLYLARQLLLVQNGSIALDSRPAGGTTVEIHLAGAGERS